MTYADGVMFVPEEPNRAFERLNECWRLQYEIVEEKTKTGHVPLLVALPEPREEIWYSPLYAGDERTTQSDGTIAYPNAPHRHLANLDAEDPEAVLGFVNTWGLLGLWATPEYRMQTPFLAPDKGVKRNEFTDDFSRWYLTDRYKGQPQRYFRSFCEPLELFVHAAKQYQKACADAALADNPDADDTQRSEAEYDVPFGLSLHGCVLVPSYREGEWRLAWRCRSLLLLIRLRTVLELAEKSIRRCIRCGLFFRPVDPRQTFCTTRCRNAFNKASFRAKQKAEKKKGDNQ